MTFPTLSSKWIGGLLVALVLIWAGLGARSCATTRAADRAVQKARQEQLTVVAATSRGEVHDQASDVLAVKVQSRDQDVAQKRTRVAQLLTAAPAPRLRPAPPGQAEPPIAPLDPAAAADPELTRLRALSGAQAELIDSLTQAGQDKDALIVSLTAARNDYRTALKHETERARLLEIAQEARLAAVKSERWMGRAEGAALTLLLKSLL